MSPLLTLPRRAFFFGLLASSMAYGKEPLTPIAALETTRFMVAGSADGDYISRSPDGKRYVVRLLRGDVANNCIHVTVMTGLLSSFAAALHPVVAGELDSVGRGIPANAGPEGDGIGYASPIHWVDDHRIAFLFSNEAEIRQVVVIDLESRTTTYWTHHPSQVRAFDIAADGTLVFLARARDAPQRSWQAPGGGYVVPVQSDAPSLMQGYFDGSNTFSRAWDSEWFVQRPGDAPRQFAVAGRSIDPGIPDARLISLLPSGRRALIVGPAKSVSSDWDRFANKTTDEGRLLAARIAAAIGDPEGLGGRDLQQFYLLDVETATTRPFVDAPAPLHDVIVDWSADEQPALREPKDTPKSGRLLPIDVEMREHIEMPPRLYAVDRKRKLGRQVLDPNPGLKRQFLLGDVKRLTGRLSTGESWSALLYRPVNYIAGRRYPLIIQSQYHVPVTDKFTLYGGSYDNGLGPTNVASYAAQSLAGRNIAVLHLNVDDAHIGEPSEGESYRRAFEEIAAKLAAEGLVDPYRVGLLGFSRNGYFVVYALSHSTFPFAAAIAADNYDPSYLQTTLLEAYDAAEPAIGAAPFGPGLQTWVAHAPGFNADRIRTPLRLVGQSAGTREYVLWQWEIFSRLKRLGRPVEMYLMPDIDPHPAHSTQNPKQILAVQESTLDWFDFWLNDREDASAAKDVQYARWRELRLRWALIDSEITGGR